MDKHLTRVLYGSPLSTTRGKLALAAILIALFLLTLPGFKEYYTVYPLQIAVGILMATVLYIPTLIALWYFDRREREPWPLALLAVLAVTLFFGPVTSHVLVINLVILPVLFVVLRRSGDTERRVIREQLADEGEGAITRAEYEGVVADRRLRTRKIGGLPTVVGKRIVQWQDELAFHKAFVTQRAGAPGDDAPVVALRKLIEAERAGAPAVTG